MQESDFWLALEYRICGELQGMPEKWQRRYWCDGLIPDTYELGRKSPKISGAAWMAIGRLGQRRWTFILLLPASVRSPDEIDWASLLPPDNVTCWLALDEERQRIEIESAAAIPDYPRRPVENREPVCTSVTKWGSRPGVECERILNRRKQR